MRLRQPKVRQNKKCDKRLMDESRLHATNRFRCLVIDIGEGTPKNCGRHAQPCAHSIRSCLGRCDAGNCETAGQRKRNAVCGWHDAKIRPKRRSCQRRLALRSIRIREKLSVSATSDEFPEPSRLSMTIKVQERKSPPSFIFIDIVLQFCSRSTRKSSGGRGIIDRRMKSKYDNFCVNPETGCWVWLGYRQTVMAGNNGMVVYDQHTSRHGKKGLVVLYPMECS